MEFTEEEISLREAAREFAANEIEPIALKHEQEQTFPAKVVSKAAQRGLTSATLPEKYGGGGLGITAKLVIQEQLYCASPGVAAAIEGSTFGCEIIAADGTAEQAERWVRPVTNGEMITGAAMTEPRGGSDFANTETEAVRDGDEYVINGEKMFIGNGYIDDAVVLVFARTSDTEPPHRGISSFVVESGTDGFEQEKIDQFVGPGALALGRLELNDVHVPAEWRIGEEGDGFYQAMRTMNGSRLEVAAAAAGASRGALDRTIEYISERETFGEPVADRQAVRHRIANYEARLQAVRSLLYESARELEKDPMTSEKPAMAKLLASELAEEVASDAIQFHGGRGLLSEYRVDEYLRWAKAGKIYDGPSEIMREIIADSVFEDNGA